MQTLSNVKLGLDQSESELLRIAERQLKGKPKYFRIVKKSLDARDKNRIVWVYTIAFSKDSETEGKERYRQVSRIPKVVVAGSGPAGLFCAIRLIEHGIRPVVIERGKCVEEREADNICFFKTHRLNPQSNIQFGEGGAGTFSDGKLYTQTNSPQNKNNADVFRLFVQFGAPEEILYLAKPHIGSDKLKIVVKNMREYILAHGGEVRFSTCLTDVRLREGKLESVVLNGKEEFAADELVLAIGHSARDTFALLHRRGLAMEQKEFAVGVRIEHLQERIGLAQYGVNFKRLPTADYKLVSHANDRGAVTFCMCPGGYVVPAASEEGGVVTNGMSNFARDYVNSNSALVVQVRKGEFGGEDVLAGVRFQQSLERSAFVAGGGDYCAPVQLVGDFLSGRDSSRFGEVLPSYAAGTRFADLNTVLPSFVADSLRLAISDMDRRLHGFAAPDAVLTAVESRTSSPVRILRGADFQSVSAEGIYPCGEGCGYAGGITSSAADGLRVAEAITAKYL